MTEIAKTDTPAAPPAPPVVNVHVDGAEVERLRGENAGLKSRVDALTGEIATATAALADTSRLDALVAEREALFASARTVLGAEAKFDGKSDLEIMTQAIKAADKDANLDGKSADYVRGVFSAVTGKFAAARADAKKLQSIVTTPGTGESSADPIAEARKRQAERGKKPLSVNGK